MIFVKSIIVLTLLRKNTCLKNPSCIDLIITNKPRSSEGSMTIEAGLSDFHKLSLTVIKVFYKKQKSNIIKYGSCRNFDNEAFISNLGGVFSEICNEHELLSLSLEIFKNIVDHTLKTHAPLKKQYLRANQAPFINRKIN